MEKKDDIVRRVLKSDKRVHNFVKRDISSNFTLSSIIMNFEDDGSINRIVAF